MNLGSFLLLSCLFFGLVYGKSSLLGYGCNVCQHGGSDVHLETLHVCRRPSPPSPGYISCTYDATHTKCKGECPSGYKFPDGRSVIEIQCSTSDAVWYPIKSFPNCLPPDYRPYDQPGDQSYDNLDDQSVTLSRCKRPNAPAFGSIHCSYDSENLLCTARCNRGYLFPDGRPERQLQCNLIRATWYPRGNLPDCILWNRNVGHEDRDSSTHGDSLSTTLQRCRRPPSPAPGTISCTYNTSQMVCVGKCDSGYYFPNGRSEMTLQCHTRDAYWYPLQEFPNCVTYDRISRPTTSNEGNDEKNIYAVTLIRCRKPEAPEYGVSYCKYDTVSMNCTGMCRTGYYFPNGKREMLLQCRTESGVWYPGGEFPACSQFDNERYTDDSQQQQVNDYLAVTLSKCGRKDPPTAGYVNCKYDAFGMNCTGTCVAGYYFPGRRSEIILRCRTHNGYWYPRNEFPSCVRDESDRYTDESQQQLLAVTLNRCGMREAPAGGYVNCKYDAREMNCTGTCATGYYFPGEITEIILQCRTETAYWYPRNDFPPCSSYSDFGGTQTIDDKDDKSTYTATLIKCKKPAAPTFGVSFCKYNAFSMNCTGTCRTGYYFPNGRREMLLQCRTENGVWYPGGEFPACSQFDNEKYTDPTQQQEQLSRLLAVTLSKCGKREAPVFGYVNCNYDALGMNCTGTCKTGYYFPGKRTETVLRCRTDTGYWYPRNEFPTCISYDGDRYTDESQQRPQEVNSQLQVTLAKCGRKEAPAAGYVNCEYDTLGMNCTGTCRTGYYFPGRRTEITLRCRTDSGYWYPVNQFPSCTSSENDGYTDESQQRPEDVNNRIQMTLIKCGRRNTPSAGYVSCNYDALGMNCTGTCRTGYYFPGRRTELILRCRTENGYWYPRDEFPSCISYEKENVEDSSSQVQVEQNRLIQETISRCGRRNAPENGYVDCSYDASTMNCTGTCKRNHYFPTGIRELVLQCRREYGTWHPYSEFPTCRKFIFDKLEETPNQIEEDLQATLDKCGLKKAPYAGYVNCKYDAVVMNCTATCRTGYYFPNERSEMILQCRTNSGIWYPRSEFPRCSEQDSGSEVDSTLQQPNQEEESNQLFETLRRCSRRTNPTSGYVHCTHDARGMNCTGRCRRGYYFPDGEREMVLRCRTDDGLWYPRREFPICSQSVASLHEDQEKDDLVCDNLRSPSRGYISCSDDSTSKNKICVARCKLGYRFPNDEFEMTLSCSKEDGKWRPLQKFPDCISEVKEDQTDDKLTQENLELEAIENRCRKPNPPLTGYLSCLNRSHALECTGTCMPDYAFSNGITSMTLTCSFTSGKWSPRRVFPPCYEIGNTPNNDNEEKLDNEDTRNPTPSVLCPKPSTPKGGFIHCEQQFSHGYRRCTGTCMTGFSFPDGKNTMVLRCSIVRGWLPVSFFPSCKEIKDRIYRPDSEPTTNQDIDSTGQSLVSEDENSQTSDDIYGNRGDLGHDQTGITRGYCRRPPSPRNGYVYCVPNAETLDCTARCSQGFHFPNGENRLLYRCESKSGRWSPSGHFPNCKPACDVPCNNGGVCIGRNQCFCSQDYRGNFCQYPLSNCDPLHLKFAGSIRCNHTSDETVCVLGCPQRMVLEPSYSTYRCNLEGTWSPRLTPRCIEDPRYKEIDSGDRLCPTSQCTSSSLTTYENGLCRRPPPPKPGYIRCIYNQLIMECTSKCADGYRYANGQTEQIRTCDNRTGIWTPTHYLTECQPVCERPCQNGGSCAAPNFCFCPVKYRGKFCQYPLSNCDPHRLRFAGSIRCSHSSEETVCKLGCPEGTVMDNPSLDTVRCSLEGIWTPQYTPRCVEANVPGRSTYSNLDYNQQLSHASQSNYEQQYRQSQANEHTTNYEQRLQRQAENSLIRNSNEEQQRLAKAEERAEDSESEESRHSDMDKERFRGSELEKESYEQRLQMKREEEQKRLYDRILKQSLLNNTDHRQSRNESRLLDRLEEEGERTESDDLHRHHFKNYDKFDTDAERFGHQPDGGYPSTASETRHTGEEEITGYGHRIFRQSINRSESGTYREHSAQQHHYFHQIQRTGHKSTDKHSCVLCTTG